MCLCEFSLVSLEEGLGRSRNRFGAAQTLTSAWYRVGPVDNVAGDAQVDEFDIEGRCIGIR